MKIIQKIWLNVVGTDETMEIYIVERDLLAVFVLRYIFLQSEVVYF